MQNILDFEERIHTAKKEIAAIIAGERAAEQGTTLQAATYICGRCQSASAATKSTEPLTRKERAGFNAEAKAIEEKELISWAKEKDLWIEKADFDLIFRNRYLDEGAEQKVYLKEDGRAFAHPTDLCRFCP